MPDAEAKRLFEAAIEAGSARDYRKAAELLTLLLAQEDSWPEAFLYLGRSRHALGEQGRAIDAFRRYLRSGGDRAAGTFFLGRSYLACGRAEEAVRSLRRSVATDPRKALSWAFLGAALLKLRKSRAAVECLEKAVALAPEDRRVYRGYLNALYARALRLLSRGEADMARQMLAFVIDNGLDAPSTRLWRARALRELGRLPEAIADCEAALAAAPEDDAIKWLRAGLLLAAGRRAEALAQFDAIRARSPGLPALPDDDGSLDKLRASVAFKEGRYKEAASACMRLLRAEPKNVGLRAIAAESLRAIGELGRSREHWMRAVEAAPEEGEFRLGLALSLFDSGDYEGALQAIERARKLGVEDSEVDYYAALCRARLGQDSEALVPLLQRLLHERTRRGAEAPGAPRQEDPSGLLTRVDPRLMFALGEALYRSGRPDLASGWFEKVLSLIPDHELSLLYRISVAESLGDEETRGEAYAAYLAAYPDNSKIRREYVASLSGRGDWAAAAEQLELGLPYGGMGERSRRLLAVAYRNAGRFGEAALAYRDLLREESASGAASPELLLGLAYCLEREGRADYALALLEKAPKAAKASSETWMMQAALYSRKGRTEAAVEALRSAIERDRGNERAWRNLASIYRRQGLAGMAANCEEEGRAAIAAARARPLGGAAEDRAVGDSATGGSKVTAGDRARAGSTGADRDSASASASTRDSASAEGASAGDAGGRGRTGLADLDIRSRRRR